MVGLNNGKEIGARWRAAKWSHPCDGSVDAMFYLTVVDQSTFRLRVPSNALDGNVNTAPVGFHVSRTCLTNSMSFPIFQCRLIICTVSRGTTPTHQEGGNWIDGALEGLYECPGMSGGMDARDRRQVGGPVKASFMM